MLNRLNAPAGATKERKRLGRGEGSGHGKTSGRGHKGQKARTGGNLRRGFEGGQMPLQRRLPKRGFTNEFKIRFNIVNVGSLAIFKKGEVVDKNALKDKGLIKDTDDRVKILGDGEMKIPLTVKADRFSATAQKKIEAAGGKVEVL
ncbi:MAG: 50S ribosomal protein L15 [Deltaproteobacteria bacterium]|nr:50S ribosomal protein L15 [Deltaproteobacteria bacterium]